MENEEKMNRAKTVVAQSGMIVLQRLTGLTRIVRFVSGCFVQREPRKRRPVCWNRRVWGGFRASSFTGLRHTDVGDDVGWGWRAKSQTNCWPSVVVVVYQVRSRQVAVALTIVPSCCFAAAPVESKPPLRFLRLFYNSWFPFWWFLMSLSPSAGANLWRFVPRWRSQEVKSGLVFGENN